MYYYNSKPTELESMLLEFLEFKKSNGANRAKAQETPINPEIGKGWPHYKGYAASLKASAAENNNTDEVPGFVPLLQEFSPQPQETAPQPGIPGPSIPNAASAQMPAPEFPNPIGYSAPERHAHKEADLDFAHQLMGAISSALMPHVTLAINEQEFPGSPIFEGQLYRERLHQMVDQVLARAASENPEISEITHSACGCVSLSHTMILRALIEALIIGELFFRRRPIYRKLIDLGWNPHESE